MESQPVICPNCSSQLRGDDINIHELIGKCARCDHIFRLTIPRDSIPVEKTIGAEPSRPSGILIDDELTDALLILRRWFHPTLFFLLFFCIAWDGFLVFWYAIALFGDAQGKGTEWIAILFPICHVAVGVGLTYYVIAGFLNTSSIFVDREWLMVRHGPVPWIGNRQLRVDEILGIEIDYTYSSDHQPRYSVSAHVEDGRQMVLLKGIQPKQADYIAWQLANKLGVPLSNNEVV